jgi:hypothetical protein
VCATRQTGIMTRNLTELNKRRSINAFAMGSQYIALVSPGILRLCYCIWHTALQPIRTYENLNNLEVVGNGFEIVLAEQKINSYRFSNPDDIYVLRDIFWSISVHVDHLSGLQSDSDRHTRTAANWWKRFGIQLGSSQGCRLMTPHFAGLARDLPTAEFSVLKINIELFAQKSRDGERRVVYSMSESKSWLYQAG